MAPTPSRLVRALPYRPALRHPTMRRLLPGFVFSSLGDGMAVVAVGWLAIDLAPASNRSVWVALAAAAYVLPGALGALFLGPWLRQRSPAHLAGWDAILRMCALGTIPVCYAVGFLSIQAYVALLAASSVLHSWGQGGIYTLVARVLPERDHLAGNALLSSVGAFATIVGPMLAGALIVVGGRRPCSPSTRSPSSCSPSPSSSCCPTSVRPHPRTRRERRASRPSGATPPSWAC
ncbi:hypothetical protein EHYA_10350 [Embleya hyalina]|uniref:MFS transporter n=1 Tax=Embleya hyalina TaxID=516124 RepID=A0A401Z6V7_9ACTN|nr:hypothetical protein [Embleya hyalina]GCE02573.1 hypothetical protein EHYA_10350 [Embleya hyalina]